MSIKTDLMKIMGKAVMMQKRAADDVLAVWEDKKHTDAAKYEAASLIADRLTKQMESLQAELRAAKEQALHELEACQSFNSFDRLSNNEYQKRLIMETDFIQRIPDTMTQEVIANRVSVFFGDELARQILSSVVDGVSESRKTRGIEGFSARELFPDVYGLQRAALDKITAAIDTQLFKAASDFYAKPPEKRSNEKRGFVHNRGWTSPP